jgi:ribosomal subunit interface protein
MESPVQIAFKNMSSSPSLRALIEDRAAKLERKYDAITHCQVTVELPARHQAQGRLFHVRIHLGIRDHELTVDREPQLDPRHADAHIAVRHAFDAMEKQLLKLRQRQRTQDSKRHEGQPRGTLVRLFPQEDYGFIGLEDGTEVYFHRNALVDGSFDQLEEGVAMSFIEEQGTDGPQASTVHLLG